MEKIVLKSILVEHFECGNLNNIIIASVNIWAELFCVILNCYSVLFFDEYAIGPYLCLLASTNDKSQKEYRKNTDFSLRAREGKKCSEYANLVYRTYIDTMCSSSSINTYR